LQNEVCPENKKPPEGGLETTWRKGRRIEPMYGFRLTDTWL